MRELTQEIVEEVKSGLHKKYDSQLEGIGFKFELFNNNVNNLEFFVEILDLKGDSVKNKDYFLVCNWLPSRVSYRDFLFYLNKDE